MHDIYLYIPYFQVKPRKHVSRDMQKIRDKRKKDAGGIFLGEVQTDLITPIVCKDGGSVLQYPFLVVRPEHDERGGEGGCGGGESAHPLHQHHHHAKHQPRADQ